jgi:hypothetical protein
MHYRIVFYLYMYVSILATHGDLPVTYNMYPSPQEAIVSAKPSALTNMHGYPKTTTSVIVHIASSTSVCNGRTNVPL